VGWLGELRKWNLAPLGAVLVVVVLGAGFLTMVATGGEPDPEELIRKYFASPAGGGASPEQARRISVSNCVGTGRTAYGEVEYRCTVVFGDKSYTACFAWNSKRVVAGSRELVSPPRCTELRWSRVAGSLVSP
jgi:hypothetical protein